jgi:bacterioferritin
MQSVICQLRIILKSPILDFSLALLHQSRMPSVDKDILRHLNDVLKNKLTGINQYFLHARMLKHDGRVQMADYEFKVSLEAMKHSDMLVEHILALGGKPQMQSLGRLMIGESEEEMLHNDLTLAETALVQIEAAIVLSQSKSDAATAALLSRILESQQEHIEFIRRTIATRNLKECA